MPCMENKVSIIIEVKIPFVIRPEISPFWLVSHSDLGKGCINRPLSLLFVHSWRDRELRRRSYFLQFTERAVVVPPVAGGVGRPLLPPEDSKIREAARAVS